VRYGPNTVSFNQPAALKSIYGHKANVRKSDFYLAFPAAPGVFSSHTAIDRHAHARKRRVMSHAFSESAIKGVEQYVLTHVQSYIQKLAGGARSQEWTEARDVSKWSTYFSFDVMGDLAFGKSFGMLDGDVPENRRATFLLSQAAKRHNTVNHSSGHRSSASS
jgi:cytochrome P450